MPRSRIRLELLPLVLALVLTGGAAYGFLRLAVPESALPWLRVAARSHPLVVHFPIALLAVALFFDVLFRRKEGDCGDATYWTLVLGALGAVVSSIVGWLHGALEPHSDSVHELLDQHRWVAIAATGCALVAAIGGYGYRTNGRRGYLWPWRAGLLFAVVLSAIGGHLGGTLVYGEGFLFEPLEDARAKAGGAEPESSSTVQRADAPPPGATIDFTTQIKPLLDQHCIECHGPTKKKGLLRLDRWSERVAGIEGKREPVIVPGKPDESDCIRRMILPPDDEDFMPPEKDPVPAEQIELFRKWIAEGAYWPKEAPGTQSAEPKSSDKTDDAGDDAADDGDSKDDGGK